MIWSMWGSGKGSLGQTLLRSLKSTQRRQDLSFFGTMTRFSSQSRCLISLVNPASSSWASSSPIACHLGSKKCRNVCLTGLNPFVVLRLCSASLRGIPGISQGCQAKMSQFSRRNALRAASIVGSSCAPMAAVLLGSVGCTWNLTISFAGLKEVDLGLLSRITSSLSTVERRLVSSLTARESDSASRARDAVLFSAQSAISGSLVIVITPLGPGILSFMYP